ncbi:MAG: sigma-70 family RNA polymerase sigma factor [Chloroflexi bacterium]|nr:MAG: sigma-70 family RNA polymerase sigma factor [Chloroflexota bacterium]
MAWRATSRGWKEPVGGSLRSLRLGGDVRRRRVGRKTLFTKSSAMAEGAQSDEVEARFTTIVEEYGRFLRHTIVQLCPKDLGIQFDDIEQEARLRLWRALQRGKEIRDVASYIYRVAVTTTIDAVRRVKARREEQLQLAEEVEAGEKQMDPVLVDRRTPPELVAERRQVMRKVEAALSRLPDNRRRAVGLHLMGLTSQEIAELLGWSEPKARNLVYRGLNELRQRLRAEGVEYEVDQ